jgi:hypothetical protein
MDLCKVSLNREPLEELFRHERFTITNADELATGNLQDLRYMGVRDLTAPNDTDSKHFGYPARYR